MIDKRICDLREKLNYSIINEDDYNIIYKMSIELDELIAKYYEKDIIFTKDTTKKVKKYCNL